MSKIAFVVHRYGEEISGGAEYHCRQLAVRLTPYFEVEVLTSTAVHFPWDNSYDPGESIQDGVTIRRFSVEDVNSTDIVLPNVFANVQDISAEEKKQMEKEWKEVCKDGPYCPELTRFVEEHGREYSSIIVFSYPHFTSMSVLATGLPHVVLIPTAHDEPKLYRYIYDILFSLSVAIMYETDTEERLVESIFKVKEKPHMYNCMGMEIPDISDIEETIKKSPMDENYIVYVGRVGFTKNFQELNRYFIEYKKSHDTNLKLVVIGRINTGFSLLYHEDIIYIGFCDEDEKAKWIRNAKALILPSVRESLSIVLLEAMANRVPVLVNAQCDVTKEQCIKSNGGLYYENYLDFDMMLTSLLTDSDKNDELGRNGRSFVIENYNWDSVIGRVKAFINGLEEVIYDR